MGRPRNRELERLKVETHNKDVIFAIKRLYYDDSEPPEAFEPLYRNIRLHGSRNAGRSAVVRSGKLVERDSDDELGLF